MAGLKPDFVPYHLTTRKRWKCSNNKCNRQFSATTDTPLASHKLSFRDLLITLALFAKAPKGLSAIRLSHELEVWYKTAFVLLHKIREQLGIKQHSRKLRGIVEIDGGYNGGYVRPRNKRSDRGDGRATRYAPNRQCVVIFRERHGGSRAFVCSESDAAKFAHEVVEPGSMIVCDDNPAYNRLHAQYKVIRINHNRQFADGEASTNWAESYFARLDRAEKGIHHRIAGNYLDQYADEMSWREDNRRQRDDHKFHEIGQLMTSGGVSRKWKGYWQRHERVAA